MKTAAVASILVAASALLFIQPVFAQADHDSPSQIGRGAWGSTHPVDSDNVPPPSASYGASHHLFDDLSPTYPSFAQADHDSPSEIGSGAWGSTDPVDSDNVPPPSASYGASHHLFDDLSPPYPSFAQADHDSP